MNQPCPALAAFVVWSTRNQNTDLYCTHLGQPAIGLEKKNRLVGLVKGLVSFTAILCHGLANAGELRVVHSKNHKILFLQPEPAFYLAAVINLQHQNPSPSTTSKLSDPFSILSKQQPTPSNYEPSDTVLLNSLSSAAQEYLLLHGSIDLLLLNNLQQLRERLEKFWSVWLWRWNVGKTGCGAIDFHELFGGLQSPFLESPRIPRALVDQFIRFATRISPTFPILPILIHDRKVVYLPSPTELITQQDITTLVRYLLSLLGGSEAKREQARPAKAKVVVENEKNVIMKRLSAIDFGSLANLQPKFPSTTSAIQPASDWAHRAFKWASASLVLPNLFDNATEADNLDHLLRADIGLPPRTTPSQVVRIKSSLSSPELVTGAISSPTRLASQGSASSIGSWQRHRTKLAYPHNLLAIYSPVKPTPSCSIHYPRNLENIYGNTVISDSPQAELAMHPLPTVTQDQPILSDAVATGPPESNPEASPSSGHSKHNPRSPSFNVEHALADAMSERSVGIMAALGFVRSRSTTQSSSSPPDFSPPSGPPPSAPLENSSPAPSRPQPSSTNMAPLKRIEIYVNSGRLVTSVYWIQGEGWTLAWVAEPANDPQASGAMIGLLEAEMKKAVLQARIVLEGFIGCRWPEDCQSEEQRTPETAPSWPNRRPPKVSRQRFLVRDPLSAGCFFMQSQPLSGWLSKNEIWPGKAIPPDEVEASLGLLRLLDGRSVGRAQGLLGRLTLATISLFEESFLRTSSGQWIVSKKISRPHHQQEQQEEQQTMESDRILEAFMVLPRGFGTLIEADNEMRILERQSETFRFNLS